MLFFQPDDPIIQQARSAAPANCEYRLTHVLAWNELHLDAVHQRCAIAQTIAESAGFQNEFENLEGALYRLAAAGR
jgi:hypothetical protein